MSGRNEVIGGIVVGIFGLAVGSSVTLLALLNQARASDALLSFLGNIFGAAIGACAAVFVAFWVAANERKTARQQAVEDVLRPLTVFREYLENLQHSQGGAARANFRRAWRRFYSTLDEALCSDSHLTMMMWKVRDHFDDVSGRIDYVAEQLGHGVRPGAPYRAIADEMASTLELIEQVERDFRRRMGAL